MARTSLFAFLIFQLLISFMASANDVTLFDRKLKAANTGDPEAIYDIATYYEKGRGVDEDEDAAFEWYQKAAGLGLGKAQYKLGMCFIKETGTDKDEDAARTWLGKAADQGYPPAQYQLGKFLAKKGKYNQAQEWLSKAQENGYEPATRALRKIKKKTAINRATEMVPPTQSLAATTSL